MAFQAEIADFKTFYSVLRAITFKENVIVRPMSEGLKFTLEEMKHVETSAYIPKKMFVAYELTSDDIMFKISLKIFTECLDILGEDGRSSIQMIYHEQEGVLSLLVKHHVENVTVDCDIKTLNIDDFSHVSLAEECKLAKVVIKANFLLEMLQRLDDSAEEITISISPHAPHLELKSSGVAGESQVSIPKESECISLYDCSRPFKAQYLYGNIRPILKVLNLAETVAMSTGDQGLLRLQPIIRCDDKEIYVEYYVTAQFEQD